MQILHGQQAEFFFKALEKNEARTGFLFLPLGGGGQLLHINSKLGGYAGLWQNPIWMDGIWEEQTVTMPAAGQASSP